MSQRWHCLQGHSWDYEDASIATAQALFCPTCGMRLQDGTTAPPAPLPFVAPAPTPNHPSLALRLDFNTDEDQDMTATAVLQPCDIEEIPGYELLGVLGRGGMGIVFRARQLSLKRQVAIKMILTGRHARHEERARLQREAEAVAKLQHPHIVQIHEVGQKNGLLYCSLEFVNAGSLAQFLGGAPQAPRTAAEFLRVVALAIHYAHTRGIVHRDLKPANILLHLDESQLARHGDGANTAVFRELGSYVPKISDFGLAKHLGGDEGRDRPGSIVGTPSYMAPEQARGLAAEVGPPADVYALGAVLYEMLTGRPPSEAEDVRLATAQRLPRPTELQPKIAAELETICLTCLQKDPKLRYASAEALAEDLRRYLANEPILARVQHLPDRVKREMRRRPWLSGGLVLLTVVLSLLLVNRDRLSEHLRHDLNTSQAASEHSEKQLIRAVETLERWIARTEDQPALQAAVLREAAAFYEEMTRDNHAETNLVTALAWVRLGDARRRLGDQAAAVAAYREARQRLAALDAEPLRSEVARHLRELGAAGE